jgi:predicted amidohydrolase
MDAPATPEPRDWCARAAQRAGAWCDRAAAFARRNACHVLAGTGPAVTARGMVNRAWLIGPDGTMAHQDKLILTPYERDTLGMVSGDGLKVFDTNLGRIGILVCYDCEFPILARKLALAGADMILVPACTDTPAGQTRVRQSARARAIETQGLVVQAPLVGRVAGCDVVDESTGRAALFCPPDHGLPDDGILAQGDTDAPGAVVADIDPAAILAPRRTGQVGNFAHWDEQQSHGARVESVALA